MREARWWAEGTSELLYATTLSLKEDMLNRIEDAHYDYRGKAGRWQDKKEGIEIEIFNERH